MKKTDGLIDKGINRFIKSIDLSNSADWMEEELKNFIRIQSSRPANKFQLGERVSFPFGDDIAVGAIQIIDWRGNKKWEDGALWSYDIMCESLPGSNTPCLVKHVSEKEIRSLKVTELYPLKGNECFFKGVNLVSKVAQLKPLPKPSNKFEIKRAYNEIDGLTKWISTEVYEYKTSDENNEYVWRIEIGDFGKEKVVWVDRWIES